MTYSAPTQMNISYELPGNATAFEPDATFDQDNRDGRPFAGIALGAVLGLGCWGVICWAVSALI